MVPTQQQLSNRKLRIPWQLKTRSLVFGRVPLVMGILNVTPDSFSDGGRFESTTAAVDAALRMEDYGAAIIDIGGESTRPYSESVAADEELTRVVPVIERLHGRLNIPISIDTSKAVVAQHAVAAGAEIVNDVTGLEGDPDMLEVVTRLRPGVCVMHMRGNPQTMQDDPQYENPTEDIREYLHTRFVWCQEQGIDGSRICLDPGIGFGKTHEHNIELLKNVDQFLELGCPILIGHSRKGFIAKLIGSKEADRMAGTLGVSMAMAAAGVDLLRVHDVRETVEALTLFDACRY